MSNYELYKDMMELVNDTEGFFDAAARNWIEGTEEAPFEDAKANELYNMAKFHCRIWRSNVINSRKAKRRMVDCVRQIAEMGLPNPYPEEKPEAEPEEPKEFGVDPQQVKLEDEPEAISGWTETGEEKKQHILGVIEEEKKLFGRRKKR